MSLDLTVDVEMITECGEIEQELSMEALYHQTNGLVQETQAGFQRLESSGDDQAEFLEREIQSRIDTITSNCERLDLLVLKEPVTRRQVARTRVEQLRYDNQHMQAALRMLQHRRQQRAQEYHDREQLLATNFRSQDAETFIQIDHGLNHNNGLHRANKGLDEMLLTGTNALENLRDQRSTMKGAQRRLMDVANTLGLSNTTMRLIENRVRQDKFLLWGGMFLTMTFIVFVIWYIKT